jgi:RHS repeat-associated protein
MTAAVCATDACFPTSRSTGKERDAESGNDYFDARYYTSTMGRWMSPDWSATEEPVPYAKMDNPQSLNLYAYLNNNPLLTFDPDGHQDPCVQQGTDNCPNVGKDPAPAKSAAQMGQQQKPPLSDDPTKLALFPTEVSSGNYHIIYRLRTANGKSKPNGRWYVFEHQTEGGGGRTPYGKDNVSPVKQDSENLFDDSLGGGGLNTVQSFTISTSQKYDPNAQFPAMIRYGNGKDYGSQGIYQPNAKDPVRINGTTQMPGWDNISGEF